ncbi:T9SS type A sorting domain-containing protein [Polaribacter sp. R77954]|uniref:T9SS type A sorting domain-containing protein n=1 Tax=Polaribacter sp. R77954 TaxID=3093870 RepID=UPI0037C7B4E7
MTKFAWKNVFFFSFIFFSLGISAQTTAQDEDTGAYTTCNADGANATRTSNDLANPVNVGTIDDRSCYANYKESNVNSKTWGVYNITYDSNNQDAANTLQPRMERSLPRSTESGVGSYARFTGTVRILEVGITNNVNNDGTYIMQAKGKHDGGGGSADPAICLFLAKPVLDGSNNQISFNIYREQINYRGGEGSDGRTLVYLTNIAKNAETSIVLEVGFRQDPSDSSKRIHYADATIGGTAYNFNIPEPEKGTESGIRYGAYRVKGGRAQIRWANTTYQKVENANTGATITSAQSGNWNDVSTWNGGNVPSINDDVVIDHTVEIARNGVGAEAKSITCNASPAQIIIRENTKLTVTGDITLSKSDDAIIVYGQFAGAKTGTMIFGGSYTPGKKTRLRKRLTDSKWFLISNPFLNPRVNHTTAHNDTKLRDNGTVLSLASYDDSKVSGSKYTYYTNGSIADGIKFGTAQGYAISVSSSDTKDDYVMQGVQHSGAVSYTLSTGGNGYNLIGNPYISYVNANDAADGTNNILRVNGSNGSNILTEDTIWLWDGDNDVWVTKNLGDVTDPAFRIAPLQGFFVKASAASAFNFTKAMESHNDTDAFLKTSNNRFEIKLSIANGKKKTSTSIRYIDNMTTDFDNGYDSSIFGGYASALEVYTNLVKQGNKKLAIQSLPNKNFEDIIVPVGVSTAVNLEITFSAEALNVPTGYKVFLEDRLKNTFTRLDKENAKYTATVSERSIEGRFYIHVRSSALSTNTALLKSVSIYKSNASTLKIVGLSQGKASVRIYNVLGKQVLNTSFNSIGVKEISLPKLSKGVYIVQLETETGKLNKKIVVE